MIHEDVEREFNEDENSERSQDSSRRRKPAREKVMDLIARRDHSELELKRKLSVHYEADEVADAIEYARENKWLKAPEELSETVARQLSQRNKGARYIQRFLRSKGLPGVAKDAILEREKALDLIKIKLDREPPFAFDEQKKIARLLLNRGFDDETIRRVLYEKP